MSKEIRIIILGAAALAASLASHAQMAAPAHGAPTAAGAYHSAFEGYRPFGAEEVGDWRKANDTVRDIGGWRVYAREIQGGSQSPAQPGAAPATPQRAPTPPATPAPPANPHQGHQR